MVCYPGSQRKTAGFYRQHINAVALHGQAAVTYHLRLPFSVNRLQLNGYRLFGNLSSSVTSDGDGKKAQLGVDEESALPHVKEFMGFCWGQWPPSLQIVLTIEEVEIELLAELGILPQSLVAEVSDVIEQPAIKTAYQAELDRMDTPLFGCVAGIAKVEGQLGSALDIELGFSDFLVEQNQQCLGNGQGKAVPKKGNGHGVLRIKGWD